ncbi:MAG: hypothetical protein HY336_00695 [Candidatus Doudnabacteria bacterium]|nr:hypothetical protein [Candidatus Doudnabacteria bacterium]
MLLFSHGYKEDQMDYTLAWLLALAWWTKALAVLGLLVVGGYFAVSVFTRHLLTPREVGIVMFLVLAFGFLATVFTIAAFVDAAWGGVVRFWRGESRIAATLRRVSSMILVAAAWVGVSWLFFNGFVPLVVFALAAFPCIPILAIVLLK